MRRLALLAVLGLTGVAALPAGAAATVVYERADGALWSAADDGTGRRALGVRGSGAAVSPDGTRVAYFTGPVGEPEAIVVRDLATGAVLRATTSDPLSAIESPAWAPDGSALLVGTQSADRAGYVTGEGLALVDAATGAATALVPARGNQVVGWTWSPDGRRIAYSRQRYGGRLYGGSVVAVGRDGTAPVALGPGVNPVWGPTLLAVQRHTSERWRGMRVWHAQIWTVDPAQGAASARQLTRFQPRHGMIYGPWVGWWTADGRTLVGGIGGEDYAAPARIDAVTGRIRYVRVDGEQEYESVIRGVSADGRTALMWRGVISGRASFWTVPVAGGAATRYLRGATAVGVPSSWAP